MQNKSIEWIALILDLWYILFPNPLLHSQNSKNTLVLITTLGNTIPFRGVKIPFWNWIGWERRKKSQAHSAYVHILWKHVYIYVAKWEKKRKKSVVELFFMSDRKPFYYFYIEIIIWPLSQIQAFTAFCYEHGKPLVLISWSYSQKVRICSNSAFSLSFVISMESS